MDLAPHRFAALRLAAAALLAACAAAADAAPPPPARPPTTSVLEHHGSATRAGVYVQPGFSRAAAARTHLDPAFRAAVAGSVRAQPLFVPGGPGGQDILLVATEEDRVYALDAATGRAVWTRVL